MFWAPWHQHVHLFPAVFYQFHLEEWWVRKSKLTVISQERLKIEVKLLLLIVSHICCVDWHNNGWPWVTLNGRFIRIALYFCGVWAFCYYFVSASSPCLTARWQHRPISSAQWSRCRSGCPDRHLSVVADRYRRSTAPNFNELTKIIVRSRGEQVGQCPTANVAN